MVDFSHLLPRTEAAILDAMERDLRHDPKGIAGYLHPIFVSDLIEAADEDPEVWSILVATLRRIRERKPKLLEHPREGERMLIEWGLDVAQGDRIKPKRGGSGRPLETTYRNEIICDAIAALKDRAGLYYSDTDTKGPGAFSAVSKRLGLRYDRVAEIWKEGGTNRQLIT